jgi:hypothetical protein
MDDPKGRVPSGVNLRESLDAVFLELRDADLQDMTSDWFDSLHESFVATNMWFCLVEN